jgi:uncharacterized protein (DUF427 family)
VRENPGRTPRRMTRVERVHRRVQWPARRTQVAATQALSCLAGGQLTSLTYKWFRRALAPSLTSTSIPIHSSSSYYHIFIAVIMAYVFKRGKPRPA